MNDSIYLSIQNSPRFKELVSKREKFAWILSAIMLGLYSGFILLIAYGPHILGAKISPESSITWGIPIGVGLILSAFILTGNLRTTRQWRIRRPEQCDSQGGSAMIRRLMALLSIAAFAPGAWAADALTGEVQKQPLNVSAILMFVAFVALTLCITYWALQEQQVGGRLLCGRRQDHRLPERPGDCRRLHVGGVLPGHFRAWCSPPATTA